jgi:hypothetical protein
MLKSRFSELSQDAEQLNKSIHLPEIEKPRLVKRPAFGTKYEDTKLSQSINSSRVHSPPRLLNVGPK